MSRLRWLVLLSFVGTSCRCLESRQTFSAAAWNDPKRERDGLRCELADDLLRTGVLLGRTDAQLDALLGPSPPTGYFLSWQRVYWLCAERGLGVDSEWLTLRLDGGVVVEARILTD